MAFNTKDKRNGPKNVLGTTPGYWRWSYSYSVGTGIFTFLSCDADMDVGAVVVKRCFCADRIAGPRPW